MTSSTEGLHVRAEIPFSLSLRPLFSFFSFSLSPLLFYLHLISLPFTFLPLSLPRRLLGPLSLCSLIFQGSFLKQLPHAHSDLSFSRTEAKNTHANTHRVTQFAICLMHVMRAQTLRNKIELAFTHTHTHAMHTKTHEKLARALTPSHIHKQRDNKHRGEQRRGSAIRLKACQHVFPQDLLFAPQSIFLQRFIGSE